MREKIKVIHVIRRKATLRTTREGLIAKLKKEIEYILIRNKALAECLVKTLSDKRTLTQEKDALMEEIVINKMKHTEMLKDLVNEFTKQREVFYRNCDNFISGLMNQMNFNDSMHPDKTKDLCEGSLSSGSSERENKQPTKLNLTEEWRRESRISSLKNIHERYGEFNQLSYIPEESNSRTPENTAIKKYPGSAVKAKDAFLTFDKSVTPRTPSIFNFEPVFESEYTCIESPSVVAHNSFESINSEMDRFSLSKRKSIATRKRISLIKSPMGEVPLRRSSMFSRDPKKVRLSYISHNLSFQAYSPRDRRASQSNAMIKEQQPKTRKCKKSTVREVVEEDIYQFNNENIVSPTIERNTAKKGRKKRGTQSKTDAVKENERQCIRSPSISEYTPQIVATKGFTSDDDYVDLETLSRHRVLRQIPSNTENEVNETLNNAKNIKNKKKYNLRQK